MLEFLKFCIKSQKQWITTNILKYQLFNDIIYIIQNSNNSFKAIVFAKFNIDFYIEM